MSSRDDFLFGPSIGQGKFSNVMYAKHKQSGFEVAMKIVDQFTIRRRPELVQMVWREQGLLRKLKSPYVVNLLAFFSDSDFVFLALDLAYGGDLKLLIQHGLSAGNQTVWRTSIPFYCRQIIDGIQYIHSKGVIHGDIKPQNVVLFPGGKLKLSDFGSAFVHTKEISSPIGTTEYSAPEVLKCSGKLSEAIDHWSLGCVFFEMFCGESPFHDMSEALSVAAVVNYTEGKVNVSAPTGSELPLPWKEIVDGMLKVNQMDRTNAWKRVVDLSREWNQTEELLQVEASWKKDLGGSNLKDGSLCSLAFEL